MFIGDVYLTAHVVKMETDEQEDYNRYLEAKAEYEAEQIAEARERMKKEEQENEAIYEHEKDVKENPLNIIVSAIIEREEKGQLCPQTMDDLKLLLTTMEVIGRL